MGLNLEWGDCFGHQVLIHKNMRSCFVFISVFFSLLALPSIAVFFFLLLINWNTLYFWNVKTWIKILLEEMTEWRLEERKEGRRTKWGQRREGASENSFVAECEQDAEQRVKRDRGKEGELRRRWRGNEGVAVEKMRNGCYVTFKQNTCYPLFNLKLL